MTSTISNLGPDRVSLGVTPTLWWNDDFPLIDIGIPFEQCVSEMALAGFQGCSIGHKYPTDPAVLKKALDLRDLRVSEPWVSTYFTIGEEERTVENFKRQLEFLEKVGGEDIVVAEFGLSSHLQPIPVFDHRPKFTEKEWDLLTSGLNKIGELAAHKGMRLCYHHHMGTGVQTTEDVDTLMAGTNPELVHLLLDTGHLRFAGDDPLTTAKKHKQRIKHVHLKNVRQPVVDKVRSNRLSFQEGILEGVFTVPGDPEGAIDFKPILSTLEEAGYEGWLVVEAEQHPATAHPLTYAKMARRYLTEVLGW
ncbi:MULTISPECIES: myo-inosose-2 dehydratase [Streptomyces]|uniref:myo-inosose-2 dehydratase n=1 Tax=Streptomyces TaxID=1883 RepID=UPI001677611C|nr:MULTISPECIES: myo-inosose-2 dehydratase [Streptomyces]MBK3524195.1 myo-inosose-2 dehydratase [Streptomyces sp. MBT70]GGR55007.1 myo-inosose-2 dehydratase [Streptomyces eurythermus]